MCIRDSDEGVKNVHNDTCYPALLVIGQMIDALKSGEYDPDKTALMITQTGGGCRASNYIYLLRKACLLYTSKGILSGKSGPVPMRIRSNRPLWQTVGYPSSPSVLSNRNSSKGISTLFQWRIAGGSGISALLIIKTSFSPLR